MRWYEAQGGRKAGAGPADDHLKRMQTLEPRSSRRSRPAWRARDAAASGVLPGQAELWAFERTAQAVASLLRRLPGQHVAVLVPPSTLRISSARRNVPSTVGHVPVQQEPDMEVRAMLRSRDAEELPPRCAFAGASPCAGDEASLESEA